MDPEGGQESFGDMARRAILQGLFDGLQKKVKGRETPPFPPPKDGMLAPFTKPFTEPYQGPTTGRPAPNPNAERQLYVDQPKPAPVPAQNTPFGPRDTAPPKFTDLLFVARQLVSTDPFYKNTYVDAEKYFSLLTDAELVGAGNSNPKLLRSDGYPLGASGSDLVRDLALFSELNERISLGEVRIDYNTGIYSVAPPDVRSIGIGAAQGVPGAFGSSNFPVALPPSNQPGVIGGGLDTGANQGAAPVMLPPVPPGDTISPIRPAPAPVVKPGDPLDNRGNKPRVPGLPDDLFKANPPDP